MQQRMAFQLALSVETRMDQALQYRQHEKANCKLPGLLAIPNRLFFVEVLFLFLVIVFICDP